MGDFMIIFNRKKIVFLLSCMIISVLVFNFTNRELQTVPTSSLPISNHVVILDAGHRFAGRRRCRRRWHL